MLGAISPPAMLLVYEPPLSATVTIMWVLLSPRARVVTAALDDENNRQRKLYKEGKDTGG